MEGGAAVTPEARYATDYSARQVAAARRVLVDVAQVLASFTDAMVLVGGWVPDMLLTNPADPHVGSLDVDFALNAVKLSDGRYAELLSLLLDTRRYELGEKPFQLVASVDLEDGGLPIRVDIEFLAPAEMRLEKNRPKLIEGFRVLQVEACAAAFSEPQTVEFTGAMVTGATNTVHLRVAALPDFVILKAHALAGRDKPKDAYDLCYCLDEAPGGVEAIASSWRRRRGDVLLERAIDVLRVKFASIEHYGPQQVAEFYHADDNDGRARHARRAFELVQRLLAALA